MLSLVRHRLRRWSWLAFLAAFGLAVVPTVSRALAFAQDEAGWFEICTVQGMQLASFVDGKLVTTPAGSGATDHCPLCGLSATGMAPPQALPAWVAAPAPHDIRPPLYWYAPRPLFAWASAQPRAPPSLG